MLSICAIAKNEGLYIREWVEFHRLVGVDRITVYNNNSGDDTADILRSLDVDVLYWPCPRPSQQPAYQHYIDHNPNGGWTAFIDIDEFLWSPAGEVKDALDGMKSAVGVNWVCFGAGNETDYRPEPVIERFTWRAELSNGVNQHIKSIIDLNQSNVRVGTDPHFFHVPGGTFDENGQPIHGPLTASHTSNLLRINHYSSKSYPEWINRASLGKPDRADNGIDPRWFSDRQAMEVEDKGIQRYLPQLKERLECLK